MICDLERAFGFTPGKDVHSSGIYSWRWAENHEHSWWGARPMGGTLGPLRLVLLQFTGASKLRSNCTIDTALPPAPFLGSTITTHPSHSESPGVCVWRENHSILLFTWFHMEWSKTPGCLWKKSPTDILLRATVCKQMLLFLKTFE